MARHGFEIEAVVKRAVKHLKVLDHARRERFAREGGAEAVACRVLGVGGEGEVDDGSDRYDDLGGRGKVTRESERERERASERERERERERREREKDRLRERERKID